MASHVGARTVRRRRRRTRCRSIRRTHPRGILRGPGKLEARVYQLTSSAVGARRGAALASAADTVFFYSDRFFVVVQWQSADRKALQEFVSAAGEEVHRQAVHYNGKTPCPLPPLPWPRRNDRALRARDRPRSPRATGHRDQDFLRLPHQLRRAAEYQRLPGLPGPARRAAGAEPRGGGTGDQGRAGAELPGPPALALRAQELLLPRPSQGLPDLAIRRAGGRARLRRYRGGRRDQAHRRHARPHGRRRRQEHPRRLQGFRPLFLRRPQPQRHAADRNRQRAGHAQLRRGLRLPHRSEAGAAVHRGLHLRYGEGPPALRRQRVRAAARARRSSAPRPRSRT